MNDVPAALKNLGRLTGAPPHSHAKGFDCAKLSRVHMQSRAVAQATGISYELHSLGWKAFQDLCATICSEVWGQTVQSFLPVHDGGRDGAFHGQWEPKNGELLSGSFTVQCKFSVKRDGRLNQSDLKEDLQKARKLAERGLAKNYIVLTNAGLTAKSDAEIREAFEAIPGIEKCVCYGGEWICRVINETKRLRMLVPRVYGLGDLSQILDERAYSQAREILSSMGDDLAKFVITDAYSRSAKALLDHGFVLLLGDPASGKSTIAAALAVGATDVWGCSTIKVRDADEFVRHWNPDEPKQFFWIDDAFGATQFDWAATGKWNTAFSHLNAAIKRGARIVFTSRTYIFRAATQYLKETAFPLLRESRVIIEVEKLTLEEKEQILYNHVRLGNQSLAYKNQLKPYLPLAASHERFLPEIARRLGHPLFTKNLSLTEVGINDFVSNPLELLKEVIRTSDPLIRSALGAIFMRGGNMSVPINLTVDEQKAISMLGGQPLLIRESLNALSGTLVLQVEHGEQFFWKFKHPTVRDAFAALLIEDRELLEIYLVGAPIKMMINEVFCGGVNDNGAKVKVPSDQYSLLIKRLEDLDCKKKDDKELLYRFLGMKCGKDFLKQYLLTHPELVPQISMRSFMDWVVETTLIGTLNRHGLLAEQERAKLVKEICDLAISSPDAHFLENEDIRSLFTCEELSALLEKIKAELLPALDEVVSDWKSSYDGDGTPDGHFYQLSSELRTLRIEFENDPHSLQLIDDALAQIEKDTKDLESDRPNRDWRHQDNYRSGKTRYINDRSIFDDVDC